MSTEDERPRVASEVRAWAVVTLAFVGQAVVCVWWAATLTAQMESLRGVVTDLKAQLASGYTAADAARDLSTIRAQVADHEQRIRQVEVRR